MRGLWQALRGHPCPSCGKRSWRHGTRRIWQCGACHRCYDPIAGRLAAIVGLTALLMGDPARAITLAEYLGQPADFQRAYLIGALDAYLLAPEQGPAQAPCIMEMFANPILDEAETLLVKRPQLAQANAAAVLLGVVNRRCGTR